MTLSVPSWEALVPLVAWTLLHFVWQGLLVWGLASFALELLGRRGAETRYAILTATLGLMVACPLVTAAVLAARQPQLTQTATARHDLKSIPASAMNQTASNPAGAVDESAAIRRLLTTWVARHERLIVIGWLCGAALLLFRAASGSLGVWLLVRRSEPLSVHDTLPIERLARAVGLNAPPRVGLVEGLGQAMAVGVFKPMVLLPASWLCELPPDVLESVLAHELAHVRRHDVAINFVQRLVEAVLFFHPVVWWCSRRIRIERELCCDQLALAAIGSPADYAKALMLLADRQLPSAAILSAGIGGPSMLFLDRIHHVLGITPVTRSRLRGIGVFASGVLLASLVWLAATMALKTTQAGKRFEMPTPSAANASVPSEGNMQPLRNYVIESPDILFIEVARVVPKAPYHIRPADVVKILCEGGLPGGGSPDDQYVVDSSGRVDLGPLYGKVKVAGMTDDEAAQAIMASLVDVLQDPKVSVQLASSGALQPITGEHLVGPDGKVNLGTYGSFRLAGLDLARAQSELASKLSALLDNPQVWVSVFAYNSKIAYVIVEGDAGDQVKRVPLTGNETVLDVVANIPGLDRIPDGEMWIARPARNGDNKKDLILPIRWREITAGGSTASNYQIFPNDRIFIAGAD